MTDHKGKAPGAAADETHADDDKNADRDDIKRDDEIADEASDDSFPASDPPSYTGTTTEMTGDEDEK